MEAPLKVKREKPMVSRAYVEESFSSTTLFYAFSRWLFRWKWYLLGVIVVLSLVLLAIHFAQSTRRSYSFRLTENMLPMEIVNLHDVNAILSVELQNPAVKDSFSPRLVSSSVKIVKGAGGGTSDMLDVTLTMAKKGNTDSISKCLRAWVFEKTYLKGRRVLKQQAKKAQISALDTLINQTKTWADYVYTGLVANATRPTRIQTKAYGEIVSALLQNLNLYAIKKVQLQAELDALSQGQLTLGDIHEQSAQKLNVKLLLSLVAVWVVVFLVALFLWLLRYSYSVSAAAVRMQRLSVLEEEDNNV